MLRDRFVEAARDPACLCAIDARGQLGRLLSAITAASPQPGLPLNPATFGTITWHGLAEALIAASAGDFAFEWTGVTISKPATSQQVIGNAATTSVYMDASALSTNAYVLHVSGYAGVSGVWSNVDAAKATATVDSSIAYIRILSTAVPVGVTCTIRVVRAGGVVTIYLDGAVIGVYTGTAKVMTYTPGYTAANGWSGYTYAMSVTVGGVVTWAKTRTWESDHGLADLINIRADAAGRMLPYVSSQAGYVTTGVDLRGRTASWSMLWRGSLALATSPYLAGQDAMGSTSAAKISFYHTGSALRLIVGNGTTTVDLTTSAVSYGASAIVVWDAAALTASVYVDGVLKGSAAIPAGFTIYASIAIPRLRAYAASGLDYFAFWGRALTASEVKALA